MFKSFFPQPKWFLLSLLIWGSLNIAMWYSGGNAWGEYFGFSQGYASAEAAAGVGRFSSEAFVWFYLWYFAAVLFFASFWYLYCPHPWQRWSIWGSAFILFNIWLGVQLSVAMNAWFGPFWDIIQNLLNQNGGDIMLLWKGLLPFIWIALLSVSIGVLNLFFVSHYIFRWRTAMTEYFTMHWAQLRHVEGASQRIQEDTMRFAATLEILGVALIHSIMVLIAFFPILIQLSSHVPTLPLFGQLDYSLVWVALTWSLLGTLLLMLVGIKLPGLEFNNQKVEAAYRKELVYGEDHAERAQPQTLQQLFRRVRQNYYRLYYHYAYFNMASHWYIQLDILVGLVVLFPAIAAGSISLGLINQIMHVFGQVRESFQYLVSSWKTIIELISIYKRLKAFESILD